MGSESMLERGLRGCEARQLRLHDRRHTAASHAVMSGENLPLVGKLLGHRRHRTTASYARFADEHVVAAAERVGSVIEQAMEGDTGAQR